MSKPSIVLTAFVGVLLILGSWLIFLSEPANQPPAHKKTQQLVEDSAASGQLEALAPVVAAEYHEHDVTNAVATEEMADGYYEFAYDELLLYKYDLLFAALPLSNYDREKLKKLLVEREQASNAHDVLLGRQSQLLQAIDTKVSALLTAADYQLYDDLKNSEAERLQLVEYKSKLVPSAVLTADQERDLLLAKISSRKNISHAIQAMPVYAESQHRERADYLIDALRQQTQAYLDRIKPLLTIEQYAALVEYENNQFESRYRTYQKALLKEAKAAAE